jgi:hypothetical protein
MPLTNAEAAELIDTDEETIEAAVDELGLANNAIGLDDLNLIDELLDD